jgi:endothelin-converting enzyme
MASQNYEIQDTDQIVPDHKPSGGEGAPFDVTTREIVLAILSAVLLIIVFILGVMLATSVTEVQVLDKYCSTPECLISAGQLAESSNRSVGPCDDFHTYACGGWGDHHRIPQTESDITVYSHTYDNNQQQLRRLLEAPVVWNTPDSTERKLKHFFMSCMEGYEIMKNAGDPLIHVFSTALGEWYVFSPSFPGFDFNKGLRMTHVDYWTNALFTFVVAPDGHAPKKHIIEVSVSKGRETFVCITHRQTNDNDRSMTMSEDQVARNKGC